MPRSGGRYDRADDAEPAGSRRTRCQAGFSSRDGSVAATMLSDIIAKALAVPGNHATRSIKDVEHIVVLM
jgi:phospholipase C